MDDLERSPAVARRLWRVGEPVHAIVYFHPRSIAVWADVGLQGFWRGYFATRAAPLGAVGPGPVTATFYNFAPDMVARAVPDVWSRATPREAIEARLRGAEDALRDVLGADADGAEIASAAEIVRAAVDGVPVSGRALFAANASLPWPDAPLLALWHGLTLVREHRGDGHNAVLAAAGIEGCAAHGLAAAVGRTPRDVTQPARGWTDDAWDAGIRTLEEQGLVDATGAATDEGRSRHAMVERRTDELALEPWRTVDDAALEALVITLARLAGRIAAAGVIRFPNPMGLPEPT